MLNIWILKAVETPKSEQKASDIEQERSEMGAITGSFDFLLPAADYGLISTAKLGESQ